VKFCYYDTLCNCPEFNEYDPALKSPTERLAKLHYVKHGPLQPEPADGFLRADNGRCFRADWYLRFPWLEYSVSKQVAFCFHCRFFAVDSMMPCLGGQVDAAFISNSFNA